MHITAAQVAHMKKYSEESFLRRVIQFAVEGQKADPDDPELRHKCEELVRRARKFGFSTELEVATFTVCGFSYGIDFHANKDLPFRQILTDKETDFASKADKMVEILENSKNGSDGSNQT